MRSSAFVRIAWVICWSVTICWKSAFSASRISEAFFISACISVTESIFSLIDLVSVSMVFVRSEMVASRSAFLSSAAARVRLFLFISSMHQSRCFESSADCFESSATMASIAALTLVKASSCTACASAASSALPVRRRACAARRRRACSPLESCFNCRKEAEFTVLSKFSNASSELRKAMVSSTATSSSRRLFVRASYSASVAEHFFLRFIRKVWSILSWAWVSVNSSYAAAFFSRNSASSCSSSICCFLPASISASLASLSAW
mmetsp:Transcript_35539/g.94157  ORF Transcript_35539/g.94157 Transcript_35539/m.94157 type:complete len:264 (-) Transcript_35539:103-894(-)